MLYLKILCDLCAILMLYECYIFVIFCVFFRIF